MSKIRIVTDSTADIPQEVREQLKVEMVPLKVHFAEETFVDAVTIQSEQFYEKLKQAKDLPTTSQPSPNDFLETYNKILAEDDETEIISIHLSAAMSGTIHSAKLAQSMLDQPERVKIFDGRSASYGTGFLVIAAVNAAKQGLSSSEIIPLIEEIREEMQLYFFVDTLEYLQKGGRIGKAAALFGTLLNIKPILSIDDEGEVTSVDKIRGQKKAVAKVVQNYKDHFGDEPVIAVFAHGDTDLSHFVMDKIHTELNVKHTRETTVGPVIGTHAGPGTIGMFLYPERYAKYL
ncbi:DegV family protein [Longirhabdus pacifica]|uniref:DegV family protein n=1 Tax=Longirhabdus pacifica TaxID=2305227 RepID=UPI001009393A|nr:DegV family protein [Longirhabdus pacifica]